jgi:hypothetical protein
MTKNVLKIYHSILLMDKDKNLCATIVYIIHVYKLVQAQIGEAKLSTTYSHI